jgi:colanic acid/amylovoran biosynthesis glycosyltransferase
MAKPEAASPAGAVFFFTRFPVYSEVFLQREIAHFSDNGLAMRLVSLWGGDRIWEGKPVERNHLGHALKGLLWLPYWLIRKPRVIGHLLALVWCPRGAGLLNWAENLLGAGYALQAARRWQACGATHFHAVWASAPAMAAYALQQLTGIPFSFGAHAYDLFEHGGDGWLRQKGARAAWVRSSTEAGKQRLEELGLPAAKVLLARRGLAKLPPARPLRAPSPPYRILSVGRMVEKMGYRRQIALYRQLKAAGLPFTVEWIGDGPGREKLEAAAREAGLAAEIRMLGRLPYAGVEHAYQRSDCFVFSGCVDRNGDRAGLPNALAEAMAWGLLVFASDVGAVREAVRDGWNGYLWGGEPAADVVLAALAQPEEQAPLRQRAREWAVREYDLRRNLAPMLERLGAATFDPTRGCNQL